MHSLSHTVLFAILLLCGHFVPLFAAKCAGDPPTYNGLPCATTTRYWDDQEGACGCGDSSGPFSWSYAGYTAAGSAQIFGGDSTWCGSGCGVCYELTPTGDCTTPSTGCAPSTSPIVVMVTNLCPNNGNEEWCPNAGDVNTFGYGAHFDLMDLDMDGLITALGWNNPVVTYKQVACGSNGSPSCSDSSQCVCTNAATGCAASSHSNSSTAASSTTEHGGATTTTKHGTTSTTEHGTTATTEHGTTATTEHGTTSTTKHGSTSTSTTKHGSTSTTKHGSTSTTKHGSTSTTKHH